MPIIRKKLYETEGRSKDLRYDEETDTVEIRIGGVWYPSPENDPRRTPTLPPRTGSDPRCDAAANLVANWHTWMDDTINSLTLSAGFAALVSLLFSRVPILGGGASLFLGLIEGAIAALMSAGATDLNNSFTETVYENLQCYFYCHMDDDGQLSRAGLDRVLADVFENEDVTVYNTMLFLALSMGEGGLSDWATMGSVTGDCDECPNCEWTYLYRPADTGWYWSQAYAYNCSNVAIVGGVPYGQIGVRDDHDVWLPTPIPPANTTKGVHFTMVIPIPAGCTLTHALFWLGAVGNYDSVYKRVQLGNLVVCHQAFWVNPRGWTTLTLTDTTMQIEVQAVDGSLLKDFWVDYIEFRGVGVIPADFARPEGFA